MFKRGQTLLHAFRETFATAQRDRGVLLRCYFVSTPQSFFNYASPLGSSNGCRYGSWFRTCLSQTGAKLSFRFKVLPKELWHVFSKHFDIAVANGQVATKLNVVNRVLVFAGARPSNVDWCQCFLYLLSDGVNFGGARGRRNAF